MSNSCQKPKRSTPKRFSLTAVLRTPCLFACGFNAHSMSIRLSNPGPGLQRPSSTGKLPAYLAPPKNDVIDPSLQRIKTELTLLALLEGNFLTKFNKLIDTVPLNFQKPLRDSRPGFEGWTMLHHAAFLGNTDVISMLLSKGHPIDLLDTAVNKSTPLHLAIMNNKVEAAGALVGFTASCSLTDIRGANAFHLAARVSGIMVKKLVEAGDFNREQINQLLSMTDAKRRFPEDVAANSIVKEALTAFRTMGFVPRKVRNLPGRKSMLNPLLATQR